MAACRSCGAEGAPGARFCSACGEPLRASFGAALQRILTFAFIDLVGSTRLAQELELESYDAILTRYHAICGEAIAAHDGKVLQLYGDGALACFGLVQDAENAALAAVSAMLDIVRAVPRAMPGVAVRVGIHSGTVLCRMQGGGELAPQITGLDMNVAGRVQALAEPGAVVATATTMGFLERIATVEAEDLGLATLKGVLEPLRVYRIAHRPFGAPRADTPELVEREPLLALLSAEDAAPRGTLLVGAAGLGKSAVLAELARRLDRARVGIHVSARLNLRHTPLVPFAERLARALGYERFPLDPATRVADLAARMARLVPGIAPERIPIIANLLGLAEAEDLGGRYAPAQLREMRIRLIVDLIGEIMARETAIVTFDDFHWADGDSREVIGRLLVRGMPAGASLVLTSRPDPEVERFAAQHRLALIRLEPLSRDGARRLVAATAATDLAADSAERAVALAEGNPLFLRALLGLFARVGRPVAGGELPATIEATFQGVVNSFGSARDLVLLAAVIGRSFTEAELGWLADADPGDLAADLLDLSRTGLVEHETGGWRFGHILMQEAAYHMVPQSRRRELHRRFARALVANDPARAAALPEVVADHAIASADAALVVEACAAAAVAFLRRALFEQAVHYGETAAAALSAADGAPTTEPAARLQVLTLLASARVQRYGFSHPETIRGYESLEAAVQETGTGGPERMHALYGIHAHRVISGDVIAAGEVVRETARIAAETGDRQQTILHLVTSTAQALYSGRFDTFLAQEPRLRGLYDRERDGTLFLSVGADPLVAVSTGRANVQGMRGHADEVRALTAEAIAHIEAIGAQLQKPWVLVFNAMALYGAGAFAESEAQLADGVALADAQGAGFWSLVGRLWQCVLASERGRSDEGPVGLAPLIAQADAVGIGINRPFLNSVHATDLLRAGEPDEALALAAAACGEAGRTGQRLWAAEIWRRRAEIHLARGEREAGERCAGLAIRYARFSGVRPLEQRCRDTLAVPSPA